MGVRSKGPLSVGCLEYSLTKVDRVDLKAVAEISEEHLIIKRMRSQGHVWNAHASLLRPAGLHPLPN